MKSNVLATKLFVPPARANAVLRPRLVQKLLDSVANGSRFALVAGPAGSGKTTLLSEFVSTLQAPVAWLSLDADENDPSQFWASLVTACRSIQKHIGESALELLATPRPVPNEAIPARLINDLAAHDRPLVLVLDDYHEIHSPPVHEGMMYLLDHLPPSLHIIISTRTDPPWPLARYRARAQLIEIRAKDLRFGAEESAQFLNGTMGLCLSTGDIVALEERTEGWIAGLQLAALSIQGIDNPSEFVESFTGSHVYIAEYLIDEILSKQPEKLQCFLLNTSILEQMNAELCETLTDVSDGQAILHALHRANIFIVPLDNEDKWFRYHHLFAELLLARLQRQSSSQEMAALHIRASQWYEQHGLVRASVNHAFAAGDHVWAASILDRVGQDMVFSDQSNKLRQWLAALPEDIFDDYPRLEIFRVLIDLTLGKLDMFEATLRKTEGLIQSLPPSSENERLRVQAMVYLSMFYAHQNTTRARQIAEETLETLPTGERKLRASLWSALYRAHGMEGDVEKSTRAYRECVRYAEAAGEYGMLGNTTMIRAFDLCQYGRLDEAAYYCQKVIDAGDQIKQRAFYPAGPCYVGLAGIRMEQYDLARAEQSLEKGMALCRQGALVGLYTGHVQSVRLLQAQGDLEGAWAQLSLLEQSFQRRDFTVTERQVSLRLAMGDVDGAARLAPSIQEVFGDSPYARVLPLIAAEVFKLALARIFLAQEETQRALALLDEVEASVAPGKRFGRLMEVYLLRALVEAHGRSTAPPAAMQYLERALDLAEKSGLVLLLVEAGPVLVPFLQAFVAGRARTDRLAGYARVILDAFGEHDLQPTDAPHPAQDGLVESLTAREMEVLVLIAAGDSNQEIADKLVITVRTVKKHVTNILGKLGATNRTQAVARARELNLLSAD